MMTDQNNINRFNDRADNYDKYRPGYPEELLEFLYQHNAISEDKVVLEVGAGTGILSQRLAGWGSNLIALEPNEEMRAKAIHLLESYKNCTVGYGTAEETGLPANSVDLLVCAQAFHWFDKEASRKEFKRVLKEGKQVAIIWNMRNMETPFEQAYQQLILDFSIDYETVVKREERGADLHAFFKEGTFEEQQFHYDTYLTFEQLLGRTLSYSYMPNTSHPAASLMTNALQRLFDQYSYHGIIGLSYHTKLYMGRL